MAGNIKLEVVTPEKSVVSEEAQIVMAPGTMGEFGVLVGHTPFFTTLKMGIIKYKDVKGEERCVFVTEGFAEALPDKVTVLAETAERRRDIDIERAKAALKRAEERLAKESGKQDMDFMRAKVALDRALHRIQLAATRRQ
ncbi:MAG: F0F1 ATP synthase subunit epsilon [Desulfobacterium sp.]|nr:F0F1 ATP synthase subunit epsilon [Desulfobacterium sp.]MBU3949145.1 F0F1 ATP synthase subunit epsilon [Pseudomonadota bacterium]MBU4011802.1 F0F1 ATP synthase subunit epsilon [Pseudomonadota bacterium]MBU4036521.1 F0F1 ATP synthase subunit epsilon [Pseudomonadota bacterium]